MTDADAGDPNAGYWSVLEPYWERIDIYSGPERFLATYNAAPEVEQVLFAAHFCESEVGNGGFHQFFSNPTGVLAPEATRAYRRLTLPDLAEIVEEAMAFWGNPYPRDQGDRQGRLVRQPSNAERTGTHSLHLMSASTPLAAVTPMACTQEEGCTTRSMHLLTADLAEALRMHYAARSELSIAQATERLSAVLGLPPFTLDEEWEGEEDGWAYGRAASQTLSVSITRIVEFTTPGIWLWMFGAPDMANFQVMVQGVDKGSASVAIVGSIESVLGPLVRYPENWFAEMGLRVEQARRAAQQGDAADKGR